MYDVAVMSFDVADDVFFRYSARWHSSRRGDDLSCLYASPALLLMNIYYADDGSLVSSPFHPLS